MPTVSRSLLGGWKQGAATLEDLADRLNHVWTVFLLLVFAAVIGWRQTFYQPAVCWAPSQFTGSMVSYVSNGAWLADHIVNPGEERIPLVTDTYRDTTLDSKVEDIGTSTIYQWVPLILCVQALLFKLPALIFRVLHGYSGMSFEKLARLTSGYSGLDLADRERLARRVAECVNMWCTSSLFAGLLPWRVLSLLWLLVKVLYGANVVVQLTAMDMTLSTVKMDNVSGIPGFGPIVLKGYDSFWPDYPALPRKVLFSIGIVQLSNVQTYLLQCYLPINDYTARGITLLRIWLAFVAVVTVGSLLVRIFKTFVPFMRRRYIRKFLDMRGCGPRQYSEADLNRFADVFLGEDGALVLKLLEANSSELLVMRVVTELFEMKPGQPVLVSTTSTNMAELSDGHHISEDLRHPTCSDDEILMKPVNN